VLLWNVVARPDPFTCTWEPLTKLLPLTVSVKPGPPAVALLGEMFDKDGTGLLTVSVSADEVPPPGAGLLTAIERVPAEAMSLAEIVTVS